MPLPRLHSVLREADPSPATTDLVAQLVPRQAALLLQADLDHLEGRHDDERLGDARREARRHAPRVRQLPVLPGTAHTKRAQSSSSKHHALVASAPPEEGPEIT